MGIETYPKRKESNKNCKWDETHEDNILSLCTREHLKIDAKKID